MDKLTNTSLEDKGARCPCQVKCNNNSHCPCRRTKSNRSMLMDTRCQDGATMWRNASTRWEGSASRRCGARWWTLGCNATAARIRASDAAGEKLLFDSVGVFIDCEIRRLGGGLRSCRGRNCDLKDSCDFLNGLRTKREEMLGQVRNHRHWKKMLKRVRK